ncbi:hypothetical protein TcWFU_002825 [Taenia crassiceps]|uniref:Uncharacterized protein n=1 Tax=Taenia crassiceps TaxID=6207 RepID=A0ABR4Q4Y1_9CEST
MPRKENSLVPVLIHNISSAPDVCEHVAAVLSSAQSCSLAVEDGQMMRKRWRIPDGGVMYTSKSCQGATLRVEVIDSPSNRCLVRGSWLTRHPAGVREHGCVRVCLYLRPLEFFVPALPALRLALRPRLRYRSIGALFRVICDL